MALGRDKKSKKLWGEREDCDLSSAAAPGAPTDADLQHGSFSAEAANETFLEELIDEGVDPETELAKLQELRHTAALERTAQTPPSTNKPALNADTAALNTSTSALHETDLELPPTILDKLVTFLADSLETIEESMLKGESTEADTAEEFDLEAELKRLAYLKEIQMKALKLQKVLQMQALREQGIFALEGRVEDMTEAEIDALLKEMQMVEQWLELRGFLPPEKKDKQ